MIRKIKGIFPLLLCLFILGCGSSAEEQLLGKWEHTDSYGKKTVLTFTETSWNEDDSPHLPTRYTHEDEGTIGLWFRGEVYAYIKVEGDTMYFKLAGYPTVVRHERSLNPE